MTTETRIINGCPVIWDRDGYAIIDHPQGFMLYRSWRVGIYRTLAGAIRRAEREIAKASA